MPASLRTLMGVRRGLIALIPLLISGAACAQIPGVPGGAGAQGLPPAATETLDALANAPGLTINTGQQCCDPPTLWDWLGAKQIKQHFSGKFAKLGQLPLFKSLTAGLTPALQAIGLAPPTPPPGPAAVPGGAGAGGAGGPGGAAGAGGAEGPGAVAAKIEANKAAAAATIQNLEYLASQDCNRYPEVIPAILQELDNPDELVRYTAVTSLKRFCKDFRCSTLPLTRIFYKLHHRKFPKPCGCCTGCQCQDQVILRLSDLLLDRNALGHPKEMSFRIREVASEILTECLKNRGRLPQRRRQATQHVEPDPERGVIPDSGPVPLEAVPVPDAAIVPDAAPVPTTIDFRPQTSVTPHSSPLLKQATADDRLIAVPDERSRRPPGGDGIRYAAFTEESSGDSRSRIQTVSHGGDAKPVTEWPRKPELSAAEQQAAKEQSQVVAQARATLVRLNRSDRLEDQKSADAAYSRLCKALLKLAIIGHADHEAALLEEVESWCANDSRSRRAVVALACGCRLAQIRTEDPDAVGPGWIVRRARFLNHAANHLRQQSNLLARHLMETATLCGRHQLRDIQQACLSSLVNRFPESDEALAVLEGFPAEDTRRTFSDNVEVVDVAFEQFQRSEPQVDERPVVTVQHTQPKQPALPLPQPDQQGTSELKIPVNLVPPVINTDEVALPLVHNPTRHHATVEVLTPSSDNWLDPISVLPPQNAYFVSQAEEIGPPLAVTPQAVEAADDGLDLSKPYFATKQLSGDVYDRAFKALAINHQALAFGDGDDDVLKPFNNRSAIELSPFSLFNIDSATPGNVLRLGFRSVRGYDNPDRSLFFFSQIGTTGPAQPETGLNFQDFYIYNETGSSNNSVFTSIPIRFLNPEVNPNTTGPGDLVIGTKSVLIKNPNYTITSVFRTITPVGVARRGLGQGFLSLEPGVLALWRIGRSTHLHGEVKFRFPIGANPLFAGEVIRTGFGLSHVLWSDVISPPQPSEQGLILTTEILFTSFLDGLETTSAGVVQDAEQTTVNHHIGLRRMWSKRFSTGVDFGYGFARRRLYDFNFGLDFQWRY